MSLKKEKKIAFIAEPSSQLYSSEKDNIYIVDSEIIVYDNSDNETKISVSKFENEYFSILKNSKKILTSMPSIGNVMELAENLLEKYDLIIAVPLSKYLSNTYNSWKLLESDFPNKNFWVVDIDDIEIGIKWSIDFIKLIMNKIDTLDNLQKQLDARKEKISNCIIINNPKNLFTGGRITPFVYKVVKLFKFKLFIMLSQEKKQLELKKTFFSIYSCINFFYFNYFRNKKNYKQELKKICLLVSIESEELINKLKKAIINKFGLLKLEVVRISPLVASHTSVDAFGIYIEVE